MLTHRAADLERLPRRGLAPAHLGRVHHDGAAARSCSSRCSATSCAGSPPVRSRADRAVDAARPHGDGDRHRRRARVHRPGRRSRGRSARAAAPRLPADVALLGGAARRARRRPATGPSPSTSAATRRAPVPTTSPPTSPPPSSPTCCAVADALGFDRFDLVGHDFGGMVAWMVAGHHPDRVRTLTVASTPHPAAFRPSYQERPRTRTSARLHALLPRRRAGRDRGAAARRRRRRAARRVRRARRRTPPTSTSRCSRSPAPSSPPSTGTGRCRAGQRRDAAGVDADALRVERPGPDPRPRRRRGHRRPRHRPLPLRGARGRRPLDPRAGG